MATPITRRCDGLLQRHTQHAVIGQAIDELAIGIEGPADDFANRTGPDQRAHLVGTHKTVAQQGRIFVNRADADECHIRLAGKIDHIAQRLLRQQQRFSCTVVAITGNGMG